MIKLDIGVMADDLKMQLNKQGYTLSKQAESKYNKIRDSIYILSFNGYISDNEKERLLKKFMDNLMNDIIKIEEE